MAFTFRSSAQASNPSASSVTILKPSGLTVGDLMVAVIGKDDEPAINTPSGWTLDTPDGGSTAGNDRHLAIFSKTADATDVAATNFTFTGSDAGEDMTGTIAAFIPGSGEGAAVKATTVAHRSDDATPATNTFTPTEGNLVVAGLSVAQADTGGPTLVTTSVYTAAATNGPTTGTGNGDNGSALAYDLSAIALQPACEFGNCEGGAESTLFLVEYEEVAAGGTGTQSGFRIRKDTVALNTNTYDYAQNVDPTPGMEAEQTIRIRFQIEAVGGAYNKALKLQYSRNSGTWTDVPVQATPTTDAIVPATVESTPSDQYSDAAAITASHITGGTGSFINGIADAASNAVAAINVTSGDHTEVEFAVRIRKFYNDSGVTENIDGTTFDFRVVESDGTQLTYEETPRITVDSAGLIGGCWVETPGFIGPIQDSNGNLYVLVEAWEGNTNGAEPVMMKSSDDGVTWAAQDIAGGVSITTPDLESASMVLVGETIHIFHHRDTQVNRYEFYTSDHATLADEWGTVDETVDSGFTGPTNSMQYVHAVARSDGDLIVFYNANDGTDNRVYYNVRNVTTWAGRANLDATSSEHIFGAWGVMGESDLCYVFYKSEAGAMGDNAAILYFKTISSTGTLSSRTSMDTGLSSSNGPGHTQMGTVGAVYYDDGGVEVIGVGYAGPYVNHYPTVRYVRDGTAVGSDGRQVSATSMEGGGMTGGSRQNAGAFVHRPGTKEVYFLYAEDHESQTPDYENIIYLDTETDEGGFGTDTALKSAVSAAWLRGGVIEVTTANDTLGYVWDNGTGETGGGQGPIYFGTYTLPSSGIAINATPATIASTASTTTPTLTALAISATPATLASSGSTTTATPAPLTINAAPASLASSASAPTVTPAALVTSVTPATLTSAAQVTDPTIAASPIAITTGVATIASTASISTPTPAAFSLNATAATLTTTAQVATPTPTAYSLNATPTVIASSAQVVDPITAASPVAINATPAIVASSASIVTPVPSALSVTATAATLTSSAHTTSPAFGAYNLNATPSTIASVASVTSPSFAAFSLNGSVALITSSAAITNPVAGATAITASPATLASSASVTTPTTAALNVSATPATLNTAAQVATPTFTALALSATPATLASTANVVTVLIVGGGTGSTNYDNLADDVDIDWDPPTQLNGTDFNSGFAFANLPASDTAIPPPGIDFDNSMLWSTGSVVEAAIGYELGADTDEFFWLFAFRLSGIPSVNAVIAHLKNKADNAVRAEIMITTAGAIRLRNIVTEHDITADSFVDDDTWYICRWEAKGSTTGYNRLRIYDRFGTLLDTLGDITGPDNLGGQIGTARVGPISDRDTLVSYHFSNMDFSTDTIPALWDLPQPVAINASPATLGISAQVATPTFTAFSMNAVVAVLTSSAAVATPTPAPFAVTATPASVASSASIVIVTPNSFTVNATSASIVFAAQVTDPVVSAGSVAINATPAILTSSGSTVTVTPGSLTTSATAASLVSIAQVTVPTIGTAPVAINATPVTLAATAQAADVQITDIPVAIVATPATVTVTASVVFSGIVTAVSTDVALRWNVEYASLPDHPEFATLQPAPTVTSPAYVPEAKPR